MPEELQVNIRIKGKLLDRYKLIKKFYGITSDAEVFRLILNRYYDDNAKKFQE